MEFHKVTVEDGRWARPLLELKETRSCEYAFVNVYVWSHVYNTSIGKYDDFVVSRSEGRRIRYLWPAGTGNLKNVIEEILADAAKAGKAPVIFALNEENKKFLESNFPGKFKFLLPRGESDYIYLSSDLANLPGRKFQKKRNHCSKFERSYPNWKFHEITTDSLEAICEFNNQWCNLYDNRDDEGIAQEHRAVKLALRHYDELCLKGGYITIDNDIVAFSFGSPLGKNMFVTHVEKALYTVSGAYNIINREMARHFCEKYMYINRENDLDEEGLRIAKLSYNPVMLEDKYTAELID